MWTGANLLMKNCGELACSTSMAFIHTIQVSTGNGSTYGATRKSANHQYVACLVATRTEVSIKLDQDEHTAASTKLAVNLTARTARMEKLGLSIEQAKAEHEAQVKAWYGKTHEVRNSILAASGKSYIPGIDNLVRAELLAQGLADPYNREGAFGIVETNATIEMLEKTLASWTTPALGSQTVLSWHHSVPLASKALSGRDAEWARKQGHSVAIRTEIKVTETKKRATAS